ncbi:hypothetical protein ACN20G_08430 [Streptomyces sp. BI20]|uniref:hypothetical protein n=1 Tax=Streptomyces sp. BI20 TaxID=3403460 RepID=UPI003C725C88
MRGPDPARPGPPPPAPRNARRPLAAGALLLAALTTLTGCGIRATVVPVDAGPAPSRVSCDSVDAVGGDAGTGFKATVELLCGSQLVGVQRLVPLTEKHAEPPAVVVTQALLDALKRDPSSQERDNGFSTEVPPALTASAPRPGDPAGAVRLSRKPEDLPPPALAQIVCTLAGSESGGPVVLGGPDRDPPRRFACTDALRTRPNSVQTLGDVVRTTPPASASASAPTPEPSPSTPPGTTPPPTPPQDPKPPTPSAPPTTPAPPPTPSTGA